MKDIRIDEIDQFLRDGGSIDDIVIRTEPTNDEKKWASVGIYPWGCGSEENKKEV